MKQLQYILLAALLLFACTPNGGEEGGTTLSVSPVSLAFGNDDTSSKFVSVTTGSAWTASTSADWVHLQNASGSGNGSFTVSVDAYDGADERSASITVSIPDKSESVSVTQGASAGKLIPAPAAFDGKKRSNTTYQLLIYTFADSDGDGVGDFKGIQDKLDYLDGLGVTALWLSPAHPTSSYHAYDVNDYYSLNPLYAVGEKTSQKAEKDFKELLAAAHEKGIAIYMDYVLNHSGKNNPWFKEALSNPSSPYRDYYFISSNPSADYSKFPMLKGTTYQSGEWKTASGGSPTITITKTTDAEKTGSADWNLWLWKDGSEGKTVRFVKDGDSYYVIVALDGKYGFLLRKGSSDSDWTYRYGTDSGKSPVLGEPYVLSPMSDGGEVFFTGSGNYRIELSNVNVQTISYMGCFSDWMPDLNYGDVSQAENNACFQDLAASADKWIAMGVDGLRLDAVLHICGGINSYNNSSNRTLLKKWYDHCNASYHAAGHSDGNIFMVAEAWTDHNTEKLYYQSLTSCFEFEYGYKVRDMLNSGNAGDFAKEVAAYVSDHSAQRADAITSFFLSNHDQDRFGSNVGQNVAREKQAGAILLSGPGKPFIYQGEELGYWGTKSSGDENVRQPMAWDASLSNLAKYGLTLDKKDRTDYSMVTGDISVATQAADANSILNVYKTWSQLRNTYPALSSGVMTDAGTSGSIAMWYMTADSQKLLVIHNVASSQKTFNVSDSLDKPIAVLGSASASGSSLTLGPNSSAVFEL